MCVHLTQIHHDRLVYLLPKMRPKDLDQGDLERRDLTVHEDAREIKLDLEPDVHIGPVDGGRPPQGESSIGDLVESGSLRVGEFFVLHGFFEARGLFPEEAFPSREVRSLEQSMLKNALNAS